jgi:sulfite reductase alpha subunit-like flavoprotein
MKFRKLGIVFGKEGGMSAETAAEYLKELKSNGRYQRDVY